MSRNAAASPMKPAGRIAEAVHARVDLQARTLYRPRMHKPTEFSDEAMARWAEEQIRLADAVRDGKPIIEAAHAIRLELVNRDPAYESRRSQLLAERILTEGRQRAEKRLDRWKAEAAEQAYRETRPEVMRLVDRIDSLWAEAGAKRKGAPKRE